MSTHQPILGYATVQRGRQRNAKLPSLQLAGSSLACSAAFFTLYALLNVDGLHAMRMNVSLELEPLLPYLLLIGFGLAMIARMVTDSHTLVSSVALMVSVYALFLNAFGFDFMRGLQF